MANNRAVPLSLFGSEVTLGSEDEKVEQPVSFSSEPPTVENKKELAPMLQSYVEMKKRFDSHILLFQVGDFYEIFFEDARIASDSLGIRLTSRDKSSLNPVPMCGVPIHALKSYLPRLLAAGHSVAVVSQVEEKKSKGKVSIRRELTRIVTPGVRLEGDGLSERSLNLCASAIMLPEGGAIAAIDCSTGYLKVEECDSPEEMLECLERLRAREILVPSTLFERPIDKNEKWFRAIKEGGRLTGASFTQRAYVERQGFKIPLSADRLTRPVRVALGVLLAYAEEISCGRLPPIGVCTLEDRRRPVLLDAATCKNLELLETRIDGEKKNSLISHIDYTCTAMGARLLQEWLTTPRANRAEAVSRHDAVEDFLLDIELLDRVRTLLREVRDLERVLSRVVAGRGVPRDLATLRDSIAVIPHLSLSLKSLSSELVRQLNAEIPNLGDLEELLRNALLEEPSMKLNEGDIFREGYHLELDRLRELRKEGSTKLLQMELRERERTGISSLKIRYNNVFGYSIEISRTHLGKVPSDYERRQTLANAERYITPELKAFEAELLTSKDRAIELERELYIELRAKVALRAEQIQCAARIIATIDLLASFAELAWRHNYTRPELTDGFELEIDEGRHPVIERLIGVQNFVPNKTALNGEDRRFAVLTGPNMGGKSTYLRQIGLVQLLAQVGSFVPAKRAKLGFVDRIFTRIGASDDLSRGDSTFMVEMRETSTILRRASAHSLVLIDEIGRGTATVDGRAIALAVADDLHDRIKCRTIFATHFHELTSLAEKTGTFCLTVGVREDGDEISFTHMILEEVGNKSYGIEVARLAGLPEEVLEKARAYFNAGEPERPIPLVTEVKISRTKSEPILDELRNVDVDRLTPIDALLTLTRLKRESQRT